MKSSHPLLLIGILVCTSMVLSSDAFATEHESEHLQVADYLEMEQVADPQISPDGERIVYTRPYVDKMNDSWHSALWIMDANGSRQRFLVDGSNARWSPDGTRILFLAADGNDKPQVFVRWMDDGGAVTQVTRVDVTPSTPTCVAVV